MTTTSVAAAAAVASAAAAAASFPKHVAAMPGANQAFYRPQGSFLYVTMAPGISSTNSIFERFANDAKVTDCKKETLNGGFVRLSMHTLVGGTAYIDTAAAIFREFGVGFKVDPETLSS